MNDRKRREFITLLGAAATWPIASRAQQSAKLPTIGYLGANTRSVESQRLAAFVQRLRELGWIEGRRLAIEYGWAGGDIERGREVAAEFVRAKVDVIVAGGTANTMAAKQATALIPIVFPLAGDPVGAGLVASLAHPGGNVTGLSLQNPDLAGKRVELLHEVVPAIRRLGMLGNVSSPNAVLEMSAAQVAARALGLEVVMSEIRRAEEIVPAFEALKGRAEAIYVSSDPLVNTNQFRINTLVLGARLPSMYGYRDAVEVGGLMSYATDFLDLYRRSADLVDKILRGAKAGDLPVEQPTKFELVINLTTAKVLGLTIPESILLRADVIE
jgi:putative tryptophan/tyrosine transport system substrate-binding protein